MTLLAHISDLHIDGTDRAAERVGRVMDLLRDLPEPPDALLVTGDIADHGDPAEYRAAARLLDAPFPVLACPGNHDSRAALRTALLNPPGDTEPAPTAPAPTTPAVSGPAATAPSTTAPSTTAPVNHASQVGGLTMLMCDSTIPGEEGGRLTPATLAWIEAALADAPHGSPAVLVFHHPPVPVHHPMPDSVPLANPGDVADLLGRHPEIIAVLGGHAHTAAASVLAGRPVLLAPAVTWTLVMPPDRTRLADMAADPGFALHTVENGQITTHFRTAASRPAASRPEASRPEASRPEAHRTEDIAGLRAG